MAMAAVGLMMCAALSSAHSAPHAAQKQKVAFAPAACPLSIEFPEAPILRQQCDAPDQCTESAEYIQVIAADSRLSIVVNCSSNLLPDGPPPLKKMEDSLAALLVSPDLITEYKTNSKDHDFARQAELIGMGKKGEFDFLRMGQLWIGKDWVYSVTADVMGSSNPVADTVFFNVLSSIKKQGANHHDHRSEPSARTP